MVAQGSRFKRPPVEAVLAQHVEDAAHLRHLRTLLIRAPHARLLELGRLDGRLQAHLDGIAMASAHGSRMVHREIERFGASGMFVAGVLAIEGSDKKSLAKLMAVARAVPECRSGLISAFGWVPQAPARDVSTSLLGSAQPWECEMGLAACAVQGLALGPTLATLLHEDADLRARA